MVKKRIETWLRNANVMALTLQFQMLGRISPFQHNLLYINYIYIQIQFKVAIPSALNHLRCDSVGQCRLARLFSD